LIKVQLSPKIPHQSGPGIFSGRLIKALVNFHDVKVVSFKPDIFFCVIYVDEKLPKHSKTVVRIDGLYWDSDRFKRNKVIFKGINRADGVVFQSEFSKNCYQAHMGEINRSAVILNGINQETLDATLPAPLPAGPGIVSCADWRPLKRPNSICRGFLEADLPMQLYMIGSPPSNAIKHKRISWLGAMKPASVLAIMKSCTHAIHIAKFDACPNVVIEELSCGLPVLHSANGGTPEIVRQNGVSLDIDGGWNYQPQNQTDPDNIPPGLVAEHIRRLVTMPKIDKRPDLDIKHTAQLYYDFFLKIIKRP
jgi:glycosyltransferase involved in cell wall biosynthesis